MARTDYTGTILNDKYKLIELIGEGGMGAVYRGEHLSMGKLVAIKLLHPGLNANPEVVKRFYREAQAAAAIRHSNIIDVVDLGVSTEGDPYLVMEYLEGEGLADHLMRTGPMDLPSACGILESALCALAAAHEQGIVHRDLKPDNIFLVHRPGEDLTIKLIDFGISKFLAMPDQTKLTQDGSMLGTPAYMSPEQARGLDEVDHRTDLYSMGVILFEMLTGGLPFTGKNYSELLINMLTEEPRDPFSVHEGFPEAARPILERALSKDPAMRYQSAEEMAESVRTLVNVQEQQKHLTLLAQEMEPTIVFEDTKKIVKRDTELPENQFSELVNESADTGSKILSRISRGMIVGFRGGAYGARRLYRKTVTAVWPRVLGRWIAQVFWKIAKHEKRWVPITVFSTLLLGLGGLPLLCMQAQEITITLKGVPDDAQVFFDEKKMVDSSFPVKQSKIPATLRVLQEGKKPFEKKVVPQKNQTIRVILKNEKKKEKEKKVSQEKKVDSKTKDEPKKAKQSAEAGAASEEKGTAGKSTKKKSKRRKWRLRWPFKRRGKAKSE